MNFIKILLLECECRHSPILRNFILFLSKKNNKMLTTFILVSNPNANKFIFCLWLQILTICSHLGTKSNYIVHTKLLTIFHMFMVAILNSKMSLIHSIIWFYCDTLCHHVFENVNFFPTWPPSLWLK